jgi:hypothetical protein
MDTIELFAMILTSGISVSIVMGTILITQVIKMLPLDERFFRWIPLVSFLMGFIFTFVYFGWDSGVILPAIFIGASSLGLYDLGKKTVLGK